MKQPSEKPAYCKGPVYPTVFGRRSFIQVGVLGGLGFSLADLFQSTARASVVRPPNAPFSQNEGPAKSVIQIILPGGLAHQESWDPKPEAPIEYRGPFGVAKTNLKGVVLNENFSHVAKIADKMTFIRSIAGKEADHGRASYAMFTGYRKSPAIEH